MIRKLYVHNFRCFENFELPIAGNSSVLLIGKNGAGKSTVGLALRILQKIARGTNRVSNLIKPSDFTRNRTDTPMRFEIEASLEKGNIYNYELAFEFPSGFKEARVFSEKLTLNGKSIYTREIAKVQLAKAALETSAQFRIDWHLVALPIIQRSDPNDPLSRFKLWLANSLILRPVTDSIRGESDQETLQPAIDVADLGAWFSGLVASAPAAYAKIDGYLREVMPDFQDIKNLALGAETRKLVVQFSTKQGNVTLPFEDLSDGEKTFMIYALVIAANTTFGPLLCYWDEPDNNLAPSEVGASILALRKAFTTSGQLIVTSHNPEAIRRFSDENTLLIFRRSHLEPSMARPLTKIRESGGIVGDLIGALTRDDVAG